MEGKEPLVRFGVSMPQELMQQFDAWSEEVGYNNRSEAIRDLIRKQLLKSNSLRTNQIVAGTIVMVYDHHVGELPLHLLQLQHDYHQDIISNMHTHLNHDQCMEIIVVRGTMQRLQELSRLIQVQKGVLFAELTVTYLDQEEAGHPHD